MAVHAQEKVINPQSIIPMPIITVDKWRKLSNQYGDDTEVLRKYGDTVIAKLYFDGINVHWLLRVSFILSYLIDANSLENYEANNKSRETAVDVLPSQK